MVVVVLAVFLSLALIMALIFAALALFSFWYVNVYSDTAIENELGQVI